MKHGVLRGLTRFMSGLDAPDHQIPERVEPLTRDNVHQLRLGWTSRFHKSDVRAIVENFPDISHWVPETGEYILGAPWRHRVEIAGVLEISARESSTLLLRAFADSARTARKRVALMSEHHERRSPQFYERAGFDLLEHIMIYELPHVPKIRPARFALNFEPVTIERPDAMEALLELDHLSFPWLWWNSSEEFASYSRARGVTIYGAWDEYGRLVSYVGVTRFRAWGHLDRIAVRPEMQGHGIGLESLEWAIFVLSQSGARRIGLSTQARNERSRLLYERYGFQRAEKQDYCLYGQWLTDDGSHMTDI